MVIHLIAILFFCSHSNCTIITFVIILLLLQVVEIVGSECRQMELDDACLHFFKVCFILYRMKIFKMKKKSRKFEVCYFLFLLIFLQDLVGLRHPSMELMKRYKVLYGSMSAAQLEKLHRTVRIVVNADIIICVTFSLKLNMNVIMI